MEGPDAPQATLTKNWITACTNQGQHSWKFCRKLSSSGRFCSNSRQEQVPSAWGGLGQPGPLSSPRNIQTQHLPGDMKSSLNAIRTWVTGWLCCVIISITWALSARDFTADPEDNPHPCDSKGCCSSPSSAIPSHPSGVCSICCLLHYLLC